MVWNGLLKNIALGTNIIMKNYCIFPDCTEIELHDTLSVIDQSQEQVCIAYIDKEAGSQVLWVPKEFIVKK